MLHQPQPFTTLYLSFSEAPACFKSLLWRLTLSFSCILLPALTAQTAAAQSVIDGLPPPPSIPDLDPPTPAASEPESSLTIQPTNTALPYQVVVNSDSPFLLEQVRRIEPTAVLERYQDQSVILVGQFSQLALAQQQIDALAAQGIGAEIAVSAAAIAVDGAVGETVEAPPEPQADSDELARLGSSIGSSPTSSLLTLPPASLGQASIAPQATITDPASEPNTALVQTATRPNPIAQRPATPVAAAPVSSDYYIVVPGEASTLDRIQDQVALLGAHPNAIAQRDEPLGPHLLIGPFVNRQSATRWNEFLRDFGMNARVYYRR